MSVTGGIDLHEVVFQAVDGARQLGIVAESARRRIGELEAELESARQELGRLRAAAEREDPLAYLLWSGRHQSWWRPDGAGYTDDPWRAGRYTRAEAVQHVVASAQCGIREHVTSMVAAPENWTADDPGVQVEQEAGR